MVNDLSKMTEVRECTLRKSGLKSIPHTTGYFCDSRGQLFSAHCRSGQLRQMSVHPSKCDGYCRVDLQEGPGKFRTRLVHRLVCEAWHGPPPSSACHASHRNNVRHDNRAANLRWLTPRDNNLERNKHGTMPAGPRNGKTKLTAEAVLTIRASRGVVSSTILSQQFGVAPETIRGVWGRRSWRHIP